jgi:hypothetical protein
MKPHQMMNTPAGELSLEEYPAAIAAVRLELLQISQDLEMLKDSEAVIIAGLNGQVAADPELTNEAKRKARLEELKLNDRDLLMTKNDLRAAERAKAQKEIELEKLRGEFSVRKLALSAWNAELMSQLQAA